MVTNNDDHPRNHALVHTSAGWRLSPAYDIVPVALASQERRDLALKAGQHGRAASRYNVLSQCDVFGLSREQAESEISAMLEVVKAWKRLFAADGVDARTLEMLEGAILPASFFQTQPPEMVSRLPS